MKRSWALLLIVLLCAGAVFAQRRSRSSGYGGGYGSESGPVDADARTAREVQSHSTGTPDWTNEPAFEKDVFTFARIKYHDNGGGRGGWTTDLPDSDLNLSWRLSQMTALKVDPNGRLLWPTDKDLNKYPFLYIVEPGGLTFTDAEALALRKHLLNGGFLWLDDFWGEAEWRRMESAMRQVFPDRSFADLPLTHPVYHSIFEINEKRQVPNIHQYFRSGVTWERYDAEEVHHRAILDDKGRLMVFATHNSDNGDGWEREAENPHYFEAFSEKTAYPLAINVIYYVMTH
jgi:hypothetical protein